MMSELSKRVLFALVAAPLFLAVIWLGGWYFRVMVVLIGLMIQFEMIRMFRQAEYPVNEIACYAAGLWIMLFFWLPNALLIGFLIFLYLAASETFSPVQGHLKRFGATLICSIYAPFTLLSFILLREMIYDVPAGTGAGITGLALTITLVLVIWGNDILAYFGGKQFGKHTLAPSISPSKTREGFFFGFAGGFIGFLAAFFLLPEYPLDFLQALPIVFIAGIFGPVGDLAASKFKRAAGIKDSSTVLPGHGGFFDRFDALLLASPAVLVYAVFILQLMR